MRIIIFTLLLNIYFNCAYFCTNGWSYHIEQNSKTIDFFNVPGPIKFNSEDYFLSWSSNPVKNYYKQEYLRKGELYPNINKMILLEYSGSLSPEMQLKLKIKELESRKKTDPVVNYEVSKSPDGKQFIIDFIISSGNTYEWNVYKYSFMENSKEVSSVLFGFCLRSSEKGEFNGKHFFDYLKNNRSDLINKMIATNTPIIKFK